MSTIELRLQTARTYLQKLEYSLEHHWMEQYEIAKYSTCWLDRLVLLYPEHYLDHLPNEVSSFCPIRGFRAFAKESGMMASCSSHRLWQYSCTLRTFKTEADHLFPWGFGGPTDPRNKIFLCHIHNGVKSGDMHLYPWEEGEPPWLMDTVYRIYRLLRTE